MTITYTVWKNRCFPAVDWKSEKSDLEPDQIGFQDSGWTEILKKCMSGYSAHKKQKTSYKKRNRISQSLIDRHNFLLVANRPLGVIMLHHRKKRNLNQNDSVLFNIHSFFLTRTS